MIRLLFTFFSLFLACTTLKGQVSKTDVKRLLQGTWLQTIARNGIVEPPETSAWVFQYTIRFFNDSCVLSSKDGCTGMVSENFAAWQYDAENNFLTISPMYLGAHTYEINIDSTRLFMRQVNLQGGEEDMFGMGFWRIKP